MIRKISISVFMLLALGINSIAQDVPNKMMFCGIELRFTAGAKQKLTEYVTKMHESPRYFNQMVNRARMYIPFVEEAFHNVRVPQDLKFLTIQESALRPDVVSSSNAVGFWQFKQDAALQYGLRVNDKVDERKHIYRSSEAAAMYLANANRDFDNWVYAIISYYEGLTGAVPYTDPQYYGKDQMVISEETHWYALKAIAHKIGYEEAVNMPQKPEIYLEPVSSDGITSIKQLLEKHQLSEYEFFEYNKWVLNNRKLPKDNLFTYYVPKKGDFFTGHKPDPNKVNGGGVPALYASTKNEAPIEKELDGHQAKPPVSESTATVTHEPTLMKNEIPVETESYKPSASSSSSTPAYSSSQISPVYGQKALPIEKLNPTEFVDFALTHDLHYGILYTLYDGDLMMAELADMFSTRLADLLMWNGLVPGQEPPTGTILYLVKPLKLDFHIVRKGESLGEIAAMRATSVARIQNRNRMKKNDLNLYEGQKLYLKKRRPKNEKIIILRQPPVQGSFQPVKAEPVITDMAKPETPPVKTTQPVPANKTSDITPVEPYGAPNGSQIQDPQTKWVQHTVSPGETLWQISKKYGTKVEIIKRINKLTSDDISQGQTLRILSRE